MNDQIAYLLISSISIYAMGTHRKDLYSTNTKTTREIESRIRQFTILSMDPASFANSLDRPRSGPTYLWS